MDDAAAIIDSTQRLTLAAAKPEPLGDVEHLYSVAVPSGHVLQTIDLEPYVTHPRNKRGFPKLTTTEGFAGYVARHVQPGTTLYADADHVSVLAVIDDHDKTDAGQQDHKALLSLERTPGCRRWLDAHAKYLTQLDFAQLIEDGLTEIARPDGATLLEVAQSISATKSASFRSDKRLANGRVQFQWHEELDATAGASGELAIPEIVTLVFEPFYGAEKVQVDARFRYRLISGKLTMGFWLVDHEEKLRAAFQAELARLTDMLGESDTEVLLLDGRLS